MAGTPGHPYPAGLATPHKGEREGTHMPIRLPRYYQQIKNSNVAEDYELDDATIREIEQLFQEYYSKKAWDSEARADAGHHAKREIETLARTLKNLPGHWQAAFYNHYLQQHIIDAYHGRVDVTLPVDEADQKKIVELNACMDKLGAFVAEFQRLKDAVNKVKSRGHWDSYVFTPFGMGRPTDAASQKLIAGLEALQSRLPLPPAAKNDIVASAMELCEKLTSPRATKRRTRKTLRNKISRSRTPSRK